MWLISAILREISHLAGNGSDQARSVTSARDPGFRERPTRHCKNPTSFV